MKVIILGASGAVGSAVVTKLLKMAEVEKVTALVRRPLSLPGVPKLEVKIVDVVNPQSYAQFLGGHDAAICTFGVGQPSKVPRAEFAAIDFDAVKAFAEACRSHGVAHFELLGSVAADPKSRSFYLKSKGELREAIAAMGFERFSCFQPSMLLTNTNRYDFMQGLMLATWPVISKILVGSADRYRGIRVEDLGAAMATNLLRSGKAYEVLHWREIQRLI